MAFNINAQVMLSGPKNIKAVTNKIQKQLGGITATVNLKVAKGTSRSVAALNRHVAALNKNLATLQGAATGANSALASLGTSLKTVNTGGSRFVQTQNKVNNSLKQTTSQLKDASYSMDEFGRESARAIKRFGAFTVATGTVFGFIRAVQTATKEALTFERELVKLEQITGRGGKALNEIRKSVDDLSKSLGIDANELLKIGKTFAQTGQTLDQVKRSMEAVARASLAPTFGTMASTTEGLVAAMAQFNIKAADSEKVLGSLNAVSKKFAVESSDLISVIRRAGGVFAATATQMKEPIESLNELIAIFTSVRSTTRETADTIATGLRTIFSRIQRPRTIEFLKQYGVELLDLKGNFIGTFKAFQALSTGLDDIIKRGDVLTLAKITEELGGIRQVGKLIPAIKNFNKSLEALEVARAGAFGGLQKDVELALKPLGKQFERVSAQFNTLIRDVSQSRSFQQFARVALETASALISVADALRPLIPLITTLASIKIARGAFGFAQGFVSEFRGGGGAAGLGGRLGGAVTGGGSPQQVATQQNATRAMSSLSAALKTNSARLGTNSTALSTVGANLRVLTGRVNDLIIALRFRGGGGGGGGFFLGGGGGPRGGNPPGSRGRRGPLRPLMRARRFAAGGKVGGTEAGNLTSASLQKKVYRGDLDDKLLSGRAFNAEDRFNSAIQYKSYAGRIPQGYVGRGRRLNSKQFERYVSFIKTGGVRALAKSPTAPIDIPSVGTEVKNYADIGNIGKAGIRDKVIRALKGPGMQPDFQGIGILKKNWKVRSGNRKWTAGADQISIPDVEVAYPNSNAISRTAAGRIGLTRKARGLRSGGNVFQPQGTDTVPAMLTPGEFVINRQSAERIGYGNLADMNRLAKGGVARSSKTQYFNTGSGGGITPTFGPPSLNSPTTLATTFNKSTVAVNKNLGAMSNKLGLATSLLAGLGLAINSADFSSFANFTKSMGSTLLLPLALHGPQILQTFSGMAAEGGKVAGMLSKFKGIGTVGLGAGIAAMVADPIVKGIVGSIAGTQEERIKTRVSRGAGGVGDAALVGGIEGALTKAFQGGAIGAAIGNAIAGPIGALVGGLVTGGIAAIEGAISGANLEAALQGQANSAANLDFTTKLLNERFANLVNSSGQLNSESVKHAQVLSEVQRRTETAYLVSQRRVQESNFDAGWSWERLWGGGASAATKDKWREERLRSGTMQGVAEDRVNQGTPLFSRAVSQQVKEMDIRLDELVTSPSSTSIGPQQTALQRMRAGGGNDAARAAAQIATSSFLSSFIGEQTLRLKKLAEGSEASKALSTEIMALRAIEVQQPTNMADLISKMKSRGSSISLARAQEIDKISQKRFQDTAITTKMEQESIAVSRSVETLKLAFEILGKSIDQEIQQLDLSMAQGAASIADLSNSVIEMRHVAAKNVVTNLETSSGAEIDTAVSQVRNHGAFEGLKDILVARKRMPDILRDVVQGAATTVATEEMSMDAAIGTALTDTLKEKLPGVNLPREIIASIRQGLSTSIQRQENLAAGSTPAEILQVKGGEIIRDAFASHDLMLESFSKVLDAIDKFKSGLLQVGNLQSQLVRQQINNQLGMNRKRFDIEDRVNRVRGRSTRPGTARDRLMTQMSTVLGRDARGPDLAGRLAKERNRLHGEREGLKKDFNKALAGSSEEKKAASALRKNTDAINRNKQATDMLANDVTVLAELEKQASKATRQEQNAQAGILGFSEATDKLLSGTREGFEAFANFTAPINALIKASHNQTLRPDEARGLIQGIQSGDPILSTFLDNLPGGENQAKELKQNLVRNLAQDTAMKLSMVGGAPGTYAELLPMLEKAYTAALDRKTGIAGEMEAIGREQNRVLSDAMTTITDNAVLKFEQMTTDLNATLSNIGKHLDKAEVRRGAGLDDFPNIKKALTAVEKIMGLIPFKATPPLVQPPSQQSRTRSQSKLPLTSTQVDIHGKVREEEYHPLHPLNIRRYANGGYVRGPSHGAGGVMANLEGGEYVVPKKYAKGGVAYLQNGGNSWAEYGQRLKGMFGMGEKSIWHRPPSRPSKTGRQGMQESFAEKVDRKEIEMAEAYEKASFEGLMMMLPVGKIAGAAGKALGMGRGAKGLSTGMGVVAGGGGGINISSKAKSLLPKFLKKSSQEKVIKGFSGAVKKPVKPKVSKPEVWKKPLDPLDANKSRGLYPEHTLANPAVRRSRAEAMLRNIKRQGGGNRSRGEWDSWTAKQGKSKHPFGWGTTAKNVQTIGKSIQGKLPKFMRPQTPRDVVKGGGPVWKNPQPLRLLQQSFGREERTEEQKIADEFGIEAGYSGTGPSSPSIGIRRRGFSRGGAVYLEDGGWLENLGDHLAGRRKLRVGVHHSDLDIHKKISQTLSAGAMWLGQRTTPNQLATPQPQKLPESALAPENLTDKPFMRLRPEGGMARDAAQIYTLTEADARKAAAAASQAGRQQKDAPGMKAGAGLAGQWRKKLTDQEWEDREKRRREDPTIKITGHYATDVPARQAASAATAAGVGVKSPRGVMGTAGKGVAYSPILDQAGADFQAAFSAGRERVVSQKRAEIREKARLAKVQADNAARADKLWGPIDPKTGKRSGGLEQDRVLARKAESTRMHEQMAEIKKKSAEGMPWEKRDRERREKTQAAIKASQERMKKPVTGYWADQLAKRKAKQEEAETAANIAAERDAAIEEQKQRRIARTRERYRKEGRYKGGMRRRGAEMPVEPGVTGGVAGPTEQQNRARARNQSRAAARRQARQRRLGLISQAGAPTPRGGGGGFFGAVGRAIGNLFGGGRGRAGGGRGRQPAAYGGRRRRGLTDEQKAAVQERRRKKRADARAKQQERQLAERNRQETARWGEPLSSDMARTVVAFGDRFGTPSQYHSGATTTHGGGASGRESVSSGFGDAYDYDAPKSGRVSSEERVQRAGPMTGGSRVRRRGERSKPKTAAQLDREERESVAQSHRTQSAAHTAQTKAMQDQRNAAMDARRREEEALTNEILAKKGRDSTGKKINQQTVPEIRAANIEKINKRIATYKDVIAKQKAKGQDTRSATGSLIKLNEELLALQKIGTQDAAHAAHLQQVGSRQHSGPGGVLRDPAFAEKPAPTAQDPFAAAGVARPSEPRMTQEQANKRFLGRGFALGGSVFKPRGTDTVPAMLTPGEFVINAGSARKVGHATLSKINNMANGGPVPSPQYLQGGGGATEGADVAAKLAESQASMNKLSEALGKIPEVINIELKQNGIVKVALDEQFVPQVKKYFEQWASEKLNGAGRADDSNVDTSMHNTDYSGG